jgi:small subunit ribosomal protein S1
MVSEESHLNNQETDNNPSSDDQPISTSTSETPPAKEANPAVAAKSEDDEEPRASGDVDFGQLLDQFEQEQATLQEGEVVRGTVVGISERGVVIDFGYKSEGIVNPAEFSENGELSFKPGDEVDVLVKSM